MAAAVVAFLIGIGATLAVLHYLAPRFGWGTSTTTTATPAAQPVAAPTQPQPVAQAPSLDALSAREATLTAQVAALEARIAGIDGSARAAAGYATRAEAMMVIVASRRALDRGRPLDYLEGQLRNRFGAIQPTAVATVIAAGQQPVTLDDLRSALDAVSTQLTAGPSGEGWWHGLRRELGQLIVLRQGPTPSSRPADRLDRARRRLDTGQVEMAMAEIERMPGAGNAASWTASAKRYVDARKALIELETAALALPMPAEPAPVPAAPEAAAPPIAQPSATTPDPLAPTL
jgi:hypothetical protein